MPTKIALIDFKKCSPPKCRDGICTAALACTHRLLKQEAPYEIPMPDPSLCRGCGDCAQACPFKAIKVDRM
jgi:translation initiation factor RLI1